MIKDLLSWKESQYLCRELGRVVGNENRGMAIELHSSAWSRHKGRDGEPLTFSKVVKDAKTSWRSYKRIQQLICFAQSIIRNDVALAPPRDFMRRSSWYSGPAFHWSSHFVAGMLMGCVVDLCILAPLEPYLIPLGPEDPLLRAWR